MLLSPGTQAISERSAPLKEGWSDKHTNADPGKQTQVLGGDILSALKGTLPRIGEALLNPPHVDPGDP